jgi:ankyrin repeat protein
MNRFDAMRARATTKKRGTKEAKQNKAIPNNKEQNMKARKNAEQELRRFAQRGNGERVRALLPKILDQPPNFITSTGQERQFDEHILVRTTATLRTAFRLAIWNDWLPVVCILIEAAPWLLTGAPPWVLNTCVDASSYGNPKFFLCALRQAVYAPCSPNICAALVLHKTDICHADNVRQPLLHAAISKGRAATVRWLLEAKAGVHRVTLQVAVQSAKRNGAEETLVRRMPSRQLARWKRSTRKQRTAIVALLLHAKANPNESNNEWTTPLRRAVANSDLNIARLLVRAKANVNEVRDGVTLLQTTVDYCHCEREMLQLLRSSGAL